MPANSSLHSKLAEIQGKLGAIPKSGKNTHQGYSYATEDDVLFTIRPILRQSKISMIASLENEILYSFPNAKGGITHTAKATVILKLTDSETGETEQIRMSGFAMDAQDKALSKAITIATKYAYQKALALASSDDPDACAPLPPPPAPQPPQTQNVNTKLTDDEVKELVATAKRNGWTGSDLNAYAATLPEKRFTFPTLQRAMDNFSRPKPQQETTTQQKGIK